MKKVSIVVPVYKSEMFLEKLVNSVLKQTYSNVELILVNDGSPDNSGKICDECAQKDNRVVVIHKENGGCCAARNKGLQAVTGEYLMFADADDWMELDCIEYLVSLMEKNDCQMAMTDSVFTTKDCTQNETDNIRVRTNEQACCDILYVDIPVGPWNKLYTTEIVKENNLIFSVPWFGEGLYFSAMAAQYAKMVAVGHRRVYNYRLDNPNSGTTLKEVKHAVNATQNIHYIKDNLVVRTDRTIKAANWHILNNNIMALYYIYNSANPDSHKAFAKQSAKEYRSLCWNVIKDKHVNLKKKLSYCLIYISPIGYMIGYIRLRNLKNILIPSR